MWVGSSSIDEFQQKSTWKVEFFCGQIPPSSSFPLVPLGNLVAERKEAIVPQNQPQQLFNYLGLENVQSLTGDLLQFQPRYGRAIRSRSKVFQSNDILYGRLRPYLNKVYLAEAPVASGICSAEFYVLIPNQESVRPAFLRMVLASRYVLQWVQQWQTGSALPRLQLSKLLAAAIPLPSLEVQQQYEQFLVQTNQYRRQLVQELAELPQLTSEACVQALAAGEPIVQAQQVKKS